MRPNKYRAKPTNGFPSKLESAVHDVLLIRQNAGEIKDIRRQQTVVLQPGTRHTRITWRVDFSYTDIKTSETVYVEAKGIEANDYKLKLKLWRANPPGRLEIWKGDYRRPKLVEVVDRMAA